MKPTLTILIEGYANTTPDGITHASPTTTLLQFAEKNYLVDPGCNRELLPKKLAEHNLFADSIEAIFLTHYHPDHFLNIKLFPQAKIFDGSMQWQSDLEIPFSDYWLVPEFKLLATPGHADEHCALLVDTENLGLVCIAQDVFWWEDGQQKSDTVEELLAHEDPFAADKIALRESRQKALDTGAKWIVPGHGKMFRNPAAT